MSEMHSDPSSLSPRERLAGWLEHLAHVLPAQAPIRDFVHHNTLHGFQHLPFPDALAAAHELSGATPYWSVARFQCEFAAGRIERGDLLAAVQESAIAGLDARIVAGVNRLDVLLAALLAPHMPDVADTTLLALCRRLTATEASQSVAWPQRAGERCNELFARLGRGWTLRSLLLHLSGEDVFERIRAVLQHHLAAHLDLGMAAWSNPAQAEGFYAAWRASAVCDFGWDIDDLPGVRHEIVELPANPLDALLAELRQAMPDESRWPAYLETLALELPGWSGMFLWREQNPQRVPAASAAIPVAMVDYLAVRLVLERLLSADLMQRLSGQARSVDDLHAYFLAHPAEFFVRDALASTVLPEDLQHAVARLVDGVEDDSRSADGWLRMAEAIDRWQENSLAEDKDKDRAKVLAGLLGQLALSAEALAELTSLDAAALLAVDAELPPLRRSYLWLLAYERHYREEIFTALNANQQRHHAQLEHPVSAQVVFCMDDREEGTRRHLEEIAPGVATYGAAGFFGVAMYWQGLDDPAQTALCPVVVRPAHVVQEAPAAGAFDAAVHHAGRREMRLRWRDQLYQQTRRDAFFGPLLTALAAVPAMFALLASTLAPGVFGQAMRRWREKFEGQVATQIGINADEPREASADAPRHGFTMPEQVDRVEAFLRSIGLCRDFAPLVLMLGHGSGSRNNPHLSAYDCGACSGRHGGPNARVFAALANRPEVRAGLAERGLYIPDDCWFLAAEHNTCDDSISWYDLEHVPVVLQGEFDKLLSQLSVACRAHAVERCRRLASAPLGLSSWQGFQHVHARLHDISQARPELGHANNAVAIVGRRAMTQGLFLDRRAFLISYDPAADASGGILEKTLLAVGPVGAGINLEYYFSTVDNQRFGCGSKITHNLTGLFGVMEGADSDLRTGLPWQMVEIHEPMRLLVIVEQSVAVLTRILDEQPALQELINNAWIILAAQDPSTASIQHYCPRRGWLPWSGKSVLPQVAHSRDWFAGERGALSPALLLGGAV